MRFDALTKRGGDTLQVENYVECLNRLAGVSARLVTDIRFDFAGIDIAHLVNIDRPLETFVYFKNAQRRGVKTVLSSIHHPYAWIDEFEARGRFGALRYLNRFARGFHARELLKNMFRAAFSANARRCTMQAFGTGMLEQQRQILRGVEHCFLLANDELNYIRQDFGAVPRAVSVVPNAVRFAPRPLVAERDIDVLVVGRIEERKNQLGVIEALRSSGLRVVFIGALNRNNKAYTARFIEAVAANPAFDYPGVVDHSLVADFYYRSKVHLSASWFEVTPLVDIEAYKAGCAIVATARGFSQEYFGDAACYIDPASAQSIRDGVAKALAGSQARHAATLGDETYDWEAAASLLHKEYDRILAD